MAKRKPAGKDSALPTLGDFEARLDGALDRAMKDPDSFEGMHAREGNPRTLAPRIPEAADTAAKHAERTAAAGAAWKAGVMRPKKDPIKAAIAAEGKWEARMKEAIAAKSFAHGLEAVDEEEMIRILEGTDESVFTAGVARRGPKYERKLALMRPMQIALAEEIDRMPQDSDAQREARMIAAVRGARAIGKKLKGLK